MAIALEATADENFRIGAASKAVADSMTARATTAGYDAVTSMGSAFSKIAGYDDRISKAMAECDRASKAMADYASPAWATMRGYDKLTGFPSAAEALTRTTAGYDAVSKAVADSVGALSKIAGYDAGISKVLAPYAYQDWRTMLGYDKLVGLSSVAETLSRSMAGYDAVWKAMGEYEGLTARAIADYASPNWARTMASDDKLAGLSAAAEILSRTMAEYDVVAENEVLSSQPTESLSHGADEASAPPESTARLIVPRNGLDSRSDSSHGNIELGVRIDWFCTFMFFIPKGIREPWLGDIREDRDAMFSEGRSRNSIEFATAVQLLILILSCFKETLLEVLTPFKGRQERS